MEYIYEQQKTYLTDFLNSLSLESVGGGTDGHNSVTPIISKFIIA